MEECDCGNVDILTAIFDGIFGGLIDLIVEFVLGLLPDLGGNEE